MENNTIDLKDLHDETPIVGFGVPTSPHLSPRTFTDWVPSSPHRDTPSGQINSLSRFMNFGTIQDQR